MLNSLDTLQHRQYEYGAKFSLKSFTSSSPIKVTGSSKYPFVSADLVLRENITLKLLQTVIVSHCDIFPVVIFRSLYHFLTSALLHPARWRYGNLRSNR